MNENSEQVQETDAEQQAIDYKTEWEKANETIKKLQADVFTARHHITPEYSELIHSTFNKLVNANTDQEKAMEIMHKMYPNAFLPTFSIDTELSKVEEEKSSFLSGLTGKIPIQ